MTAAHQDGDERLDADVEEFSVHDRKGGWARALLVARRVEPGEGDGVRSEHLSSRYGRNTFRRVSAREFARRARTSPQRVLAFFAAWNRAADDGIVPPAADLTPGIHVELPNEEEVPFFGEHGYYRSYQARMTEGDRRQAIEQEAEHAGIKANGPVYVAQHPKALKIAVLADEASRAMALEGIEEFNRRQEHADAHDRAAARLAAADRAQRHDRHGQEDHHGEESHDLVEECHHTAGAVEAGEAERAVRAARDKGAEDVALQVFTEMTEVRLASLRALSLLQQGQVDFTAERSKSIAELCEASQAALAFIRDLATPSATALGDDALRAFLEESEKKLG